MRSIAQAINKIDPLLREDCFRKMLSLLLTVGPQTLFQAAMNLDESLARVEAQARKLQLAGHVRIHRERIAGKILTTLILTSKGHEALDAFVWNGERIVKEFRAILKIKR